MKKGIAISKNNIVGLFLIGIFFLYFFAPYSVISSVAVNFLIGLSIIVFSFRHGRQQKKRFIYACAILLYLLLLTGTAYSFIPYQKEMDLGVLLIITSICIFCASDFDFKINKSIEIIIVLLDIIIFLWGMAFILKNDSITAWTSSVFGAADDRFYLRSTLMGKPVLSLRFHGQAGYAYINLFILNYILSQSPIISRFAKKIFVTFQFVCVIFAVCLQANSGYMVALLMGIILTYHYFKLYGPKVILVWIPFVGIAAYYLISNGIVAYAIDHLLTGEKNGFLGRYSGLFSGNLDIVMNYFATGFLTINNVTVKADSGILVAFTRGNFPFVVAYYWLIWSFLKRNFNRNIAKYIAMVFLGYEFAYTFLIGRYQGLYWLIIYKICVDCLEIFDNKKEGNLIYRK